MPAVRLQVREVVAAPPAYTPVEREEFRRGALAGLCQEFGDRLEVEYQALPGEEVTFLPQVTVQGEALNLSGFPSWRILRLIVGRHLALDQLVEALGSEARAEAGVCGLETECWQDALLQLACRQDQA
jgi:hypothetical protein